MANKRFSTLNTMLEGIERLFLTIIAGLVAPILLGLAGWWGSIPFVPEKSIIYFGLGGFVLGILLDSVFLRRWVKNALRMPLIWPALVYLFYSTGVLGFFMGLPVLNFILGPVGGYFMGMRLRSANTPKNGVERTARQTGLFTALVMAAACAAAWVLAFLDPFLEANISGMFALQNPVSRSTILIASFFVGIVLVVLEYVVTRAAVKFARFMD